ncbi:ABC transporter ATP-binding protein [Patescibacteria group bacterium]|nr:ABC transporter ATP-binding protein [Patescibacteria group bacterium]
MENLTRQTFKIFWKHLLKYKWAFVLMISGISIGSLGNIIAPLFYREFFDTLTTSGDVDVLKIILFKVLIVYFVSWLFWRIATFATSYFQTKVMASLSIYSFSYLHRHSVEFFNNNFVGSLVKKVNRFSRSFEVVADRLSWDLLPTIIHIVLVIVVLSKRSILLSIGIFIWVLVYVLVNYYFSIYKLKYDIKRSALNSEVTGVLADTIANHLNVKLFTGYFRETALFAKITNRLQKLRQFTWNLGNYFEALQTVLMMVLEIGIMFYAISLWQDGFLTIGDFVLIQTYLITIINRLWSFGRVIRSYYEAMAEAREMTEILMTPHAVNDAKNAKPLNVSSGEIRFENVSFAYSKTRMVISDFDLTVKPNEKVALVGASGSGKSTIINLLTRAHDLDHGKIYIDGQKISNVTQDSLWQNISLVNQDPVLFHRTLMENIKYGRAEASNEDVYEAARLANAHKFIDEFTEGYDTYVGERGVKLSGGERQRVAIARAILKNAPILVLDEATSSLDSESEELIQDALANLMKDKTVIVIAHRLSTIMKMDRIVVIDRGKVLEEGTHQELIKKDKGLYKRLWEKQVGGFLE